MRGFVWFLILTAALLAVPIKIFLLADGKVSIALGWLFFRFAPKAKEAAAPAKKRTKKPKPPKKAKAAKPKKKYSYEEILAYIPAAFELVQRMRLPLRRTLRRIQITSVELELHIAGDDAAACATRFGQANALIYNSLSLLEHIVTLRTKHIAVYPAFHLEEDHYHARATVKLVPLFLLGAAFNILYILLTQYLKATKHAPKSAKEEEQYGTTKSRQ